MVRHKSFKRSEHCFNLENKHTAIPEKTTTFQILLSFFKSRFLAKTQNLRRNARFTLRSLQIPIPSLRPVRLYAEGHNRLRALSHLHSHQQRASESLLILYKVVRRKHNHCRAGNKRFYIRTTISDGGGGIPERRLQYYIPLRNHPQLLPHRRRLHLIRRNKYPLRLYHRQHPLHRHPNQAPLTINQPQQLLRPLPRRQRPEPLPRSPRHY